MIRCRFLQGIVQQQQHTTNKVAPKERNFYGDFAHKWLRTWVNWTTIKPKMRIPMSNNSTIKQN